MSFPRMDPEKEDILCEKGVIEEFEERRECLARSGLSDKLAHQQAMTEYADYFKAKHEILDYYSESELDKAFGISDPDGDFDYSSDKPEMTKLPVHLRGKKSKPADLIQWVASNMTGEIDYRDCPGADAFNLLHHCRRDKSAKSDFWKTTYPKLLPSRAQLSDDEADDTIDGDQILKVIGKIEKIGEKYKNA